MKRYKVNLGLHISAKSKKEAYELIKQIIETGNATTKNGTYISINMMSEYNPKTIEELSF